MDLLFCLSPEKGMEAYYMGTVSSRYLDDLTCNDLYVDMLEICIIQDKKKKEEKGTL